MPAIKLRPYQEEALDAIASAEAGGERRPLLVLATGLGKTICFGELTNRTKGRTLILAHRDELIEQAVDKLHQVQPNLQIGVVKAERDETHARVVVASVQTLAREPRRKRLFSRQAPFARVIVDEAHHAAARTYRDVLEAAGCFTDDGPLLLGVTATPMRGDGVGLSEIFDSICFERDILWGIQANYLCDLKGKQIILDIDLDDVRTRGGDFADGALGEAMEEANGPAVIADGIKANALGLMTIVFTPTVEVAAKTAAELRKLGITAELVHGAQPIDERRAVLKRFHDGITKVVCNCAVLTEGFDEPGVQCITIARPTKSGALYRQMVGRGTRTLPGKDFCLVLDFVGNSDRHKLVTLNDLAGLPLDALKDGKKSVKAALQEIREEEERRHPSRFRSKDVDLFGQAKFHWVPAPNGWILPGGTGRYVLTSKTPDQDGTWQLVSQQYGKKPEVVLNESSMSLCQGTAEDLVRASGNTILVDKDARWRVNMASESQLRFLQDLGAPIPPEGLTRGAASDLIEVHKLMRASRGR